MAVRESCMQRHIEISDLDYVSTIASIYPVFQYVTALVVDLLSHDDLDQVPRLDVPTSLQQHGMLREYHCPAETPADRSQILSPAGTRCSTAVSRTGPPFLVRTKRGWRRVWTVLPNASCTSTTASEAFVLPTMPSWTASPGLKSLVKPAESVVEEVVTTRDSRSAAEDPRRFVADAIKVVLATVISVGTLVLLKKTGIVLICCVVKGLSLVVFGVIERVEREPRNSL